MHERSEETRKNKRQKEKLRRANKCQLTEENQESIKKILAEVEGKPDYAALAKRIKEEMGLDCSNDWLRQIFAHKMGTIIGYWSYATPKLPKNSTGK